MVTGGERFGAYGLTRPQVAYLLRAVDPHRVAEDDQGHSHLPQQDVRAHLTRIFGFGGWGMRVTESGLVFEEPRTQPGKWDVCYRATVLLTIKDPHGNVVTELEDVATGDAQNQRRLAGHDLALKSAVSTALKRAATGLGDQFGLSLYNRGSLEAFVRGTFVVPPAEPKPDDAGADQGDGDVKAGVEDVPAATPEDEGASEEGYSGDAASNGGADEPADDPAPGGPASHPAPGVPVPQPTFSSDHGDPTDAPPPLPERRQPEPGEAPPLRQAQARSWNAICALHPDWTREDLQSATIKALKGRNETHACQDPAVWEAIAVEWEQELHGTRQLQHDTNRRNLR